MTYEPQLGMRVPYLVDRMDKALGLETFVFKAVLQDSLNPGDSIYICVPPSCCAHVALKWIAIMAYWLRKLAFVGRFEGIIFCNRYGHTNRLKTNESERLTGYQDLVENGHENEASDFKAVLGN